MVNSQQRAQKADGYFEHLCQPRNRFSADFAQKAGDTQVEQGFSERLALPLLMQCALSSST
jgi:hypothetical protein